MRTSNPALISQSLGGVGHNVAVAAHYAGANVRFCTAVGEDEAGKIATKLLQQKGLRSSSVNTFGAGARTAQYVSINDARKDLVIAMADMKIFEDSKDEFEERWKCHLDRCKPQWLVVDGNWDPQTLQKWVCAGKSMGANIAYEPVSAEKSSRIFQSAKEAFYHKDLRQPPACTDRPDAGHLTRLVDLATPNEIELHAMSQYLQASSAWSPAYRTGLDQDGLLRNIEQRGQGDLQKVDVETILAALGLAPFIPRLFTKLGSNGVLLTERVHTEDSRLTNPKWAEYVLPHSWKPTEEPLDRSSAPLEKPRSGGVYMQHFSPIYRIPTRDIVSVNGVGDTFLGVLVAGLCRRDTGSIGELIDVAQKAAALTLKSPESVSAEVRTIWN